jgi:hypothetical protein
MKLVAFVLMAITLLVIVSGCGSGSKQESSTAVQLTTTESTVARTKTKSTAQADLTGFGATSEAWDAHHLADSRFAPGSSYDPDPSLARGGDEQFDDRYFGVGHDRRITNYEMRFPPSTSIKEAEQSVLTSEFPGDGKIVWFKRRDTCAQMFVRSKKVLRLAHAAAIVEISSGAGGDQYDPSDVWSAIVLGTGRSGPSNPLGC